MNQFLQQLSDVVRHLSIVEVLDVAVVAVILYLLLRLLRGTQGTQIVVGLILLAVIGVVATQFNLILLSWLFRNATFYIIIAIIVMFQPELRRVLDQLGRIGQIGRPLLGYNTRLYSQAISEAIRATERLSAKKTGALIAFEREVGLEDYAATGVRINGEISAECLLIDLLSQTRHCTTARSSCGVTRSSRRDASCHSRRKALSGKGLAHATARRWAFRWHPTPLSS